MSFEHEKEHGKRIISWTGDQKKRNQLFMFYQIKQQKLDYSVARGKD